MTKFSNRLRELRNSKDLSQQSFADKIGISKSSINMYERGEREPGLEMLESMADFFNVDLDYLLGKSDIPNKSLEASQTISEFHSGIARLIHNRRKELNLTLKDLSNYVGVSEGTVSRWENGFISNMRRDKIALLAAALDVNPVSFITGELTLNNEPQLPKGAVPYNPVVHEIPILGTIAAGLPLYAEQHIEGYTYTDRNGGAEYFALRVKGDSMNAINICDGGIITVRRQSEVENGEIAVVLVNNDNATVKRFKRDNTTVQLIPQSYNPEHQIQIYDLKKDKIDIVGKVVECKIEFH